MVFLIMWKPKVSKINLSENKIYPKEEIPPNVVEAFLGGRGITVYLAYQTIPHDISPRAPENNIIFGTGFLTGTIFPSAGTVVATFKSPHSNTLCTSVATGKFGAYMSNLNLDFLQITGCAKAPQYILIDEFADFGFFDASEFWDFDTSSTEAFLREKHGNNISIISIGKAATKQVIFAGASIDQMHYFRRGGLGAVLASKNIKAILITEPPQLSQLDQSLEEEIIQLQKEIDLSKWSEMLKSRGTFSIAYLALEHDTLPAKNITRKVKLDPNKLNSFEGYKDSLDCLSCSIKCNRNSYGAFTSLGPNLMIGNNEDIQKAIEKCDNDALDPISTGATIASLFNIQEDQRKLLDINLGMNWGESQLYSLIDKIENKEGIGDQFSRGENFFYHQTSEASSITKNQIGNMFYYPNILGVSLMTGISSFKGDNFRTDSIVYSELLGMPFKSKPKSSKGKSELVIMLENMGAVLDSLVICPLYLPLLFKSKKWIQMIPPAIQALLFHFVPKLFLNRYGINLLLLTSIINKSLKSNFRPNDLFEVGNRITLLERLFNTRTGQTHYDDTFSLFLPKRKDFFNKYRSLLYNYYIIKGLTGSGLPSKQTLEKSRLIGLVTV